MDTALPQKFPFILDKNLAKANCTENHVCTSCDIVVLGFYSILYEFLFNSTNCWLTVYDSESYKFYFLCIILKFTRDKKVVHITSMKQLSPAAHNWQDKHIQSLIFVVNKILITINECL